MGYAFLAGYDSLAVANYLVGCSLEDGPDLTNMGLQKILYFAEGEYLALNRRALFDAAIEAWEYGPVVPPVYHEFKRFGKSPITERGTTVDLGGDAESWKFWTPELPITPEAEKDREFLRDIWSRYGHWSPIRLMQETHRPGGPWQQVYSRGERHVEIPLDAMLTYFSSKVNES